MAKRVYELAKEMGVDNASLMKFLKDKNVDIKSHMSTLENDQIEMVKKDFVKPEKPASQPKPVAAEAEKPEKPKKKASVSAVFNPQNSKTMKNRKPSQTQSRLAGERPLRDRKSVV